MHRYYARWACPSSRTTSARSPARSARRGAARYAGMLVVVDGNNVMGSRPDGWWKDRAGAARRLVGQIGAWAGEDVLVYFDGAPVADMPSPGRVEVRYA